MAQLPLVSGAKAVRAFRARWLAFRSATWQPRHFAQAPSPGELVSPSASRVGSRHASVVDPRRRPDSRGIRRFVALNDGRPRLAIRKKRGKKQFKLIIIKSPPKYRRQCSDWESIHNPASSRLTAGAHTMVKVLRGFPSLEVCRPADDRRPPDYGDRVRTSLAGGLTPSYRLRSTAGFK